MTWLEGLVAPRLYAQEDLPGSSVRQLAGLAGFGLLAMTGSALASPSGFFAPAVLVAVLVLSVVIQPRVMRWANRLGTGLCWLIRLIRGEKV